MDRITAPRGDRRGRTRQRSGHGRARPLCGIRRLGSPCRRVRGALTQLGIFAKTFARPSVEETLQAVADAGIPAVQFNLSVLGLDTVPEIGPPAAIRATRNALARPGGARARAPR